VHRNYRARVPAVTRYGCYFLAIFTVAAFPAAAGGAVRSFPDTTSGIHVFHDQLNFGALDSAQISFAAKHYAGSQKLLQRDAQLMRTYNPNFIVLHYRLGEFLGYETNGAPTRIIDGNNWVPEWPGTSVVQPSWYFTNGAGNYLFSKFAYLMNIANPSYQNWWSSVVEQQVFNNEDDGLFMDSFCIPEFFGPTRSFSPSLQVTPSMRTFDQTWATMMQNWLVYLKGRLPYNYLIPNVGSWITTRDLPWLDNPSDGMMIEGFNMGSNTQYYALGDWQLEMNRVLGAVHQDKVIIAQTYVSTVQARMFTLGAYLLIKGGRSYISFNNSTQVEWYPEYDTPIGPPTQNATCTSTGSGATAFPTCSITSLQDAHGLYRRDYSNGFVLVNPGTAPITESLGRTYYLAETSPDGTLLVKASGTESGTLTYSAVSSVTLPAHSAVVLFNTRP
jgi:hypothetical protein